MFRKLVDYFGLPILDVALLFALAADVGLFVGADNLRATITTARTYYVCAKANGGTCVYNGDGGTVAATIADTNDCLTKATPCRTLSGVQSKIDGYRIAAVLTFQLADTAGTGTDCYTPNNTIFTNPADGRRRYQFFEFPGAAPLLTDSYPESYISFVGDTTTPGSVLITGATTCAGTAASVARLISLDGGTYRFQGLQINYYALEGISAHNAVVYLENSNATNDTTIQAPGLPRTMLGAWQNSLVFLGGPFTVTNSGFLSIAGSILETTDPANSSSQNTNLTYSTSQSDFMVICMEQSHCYIDHWTGSYSSSGAYNIWKAQNGGGIVFNDAINTAQCPGGKCFAQTLNASNAIYSSAVDMFSVINAACSASTTASCTSTAIKQRAVAAGGGYVKAFAQVAGSSADTIQTGGCVNYNGLVTCAMDVQQPSADGTTAYKFTSTGGTTEFCIDTTNSRVGFLSGGCPPSLKLDFNGVFKLDNGGNVNTIGGQSVSNTGVWRELVALAPDSTGQSAALAAANIIASAPLSGMYQVCFSADITTAATTSSSLGGTNGFQVIYTSPTDSVVKTTVLQADTISAANTTGTAVGGCKTVEAKTGTAIQTSYDYTSVGGTAMVYEFHQRLFGQ